jgi:glycine/D-amino acid oxidase-like deaminating enzyme
MDLKSDFPFWAVRNGLVNTYPALTADLRCDALVIGGGISGALIAARLVKKGVDCVLIDRRDIAFGSTSASTALLQYEIDTPLHKLQQQVGTDCAERAYRAGLEAIARLQGLAGRGCGFALRPSLQVASRKGDIGSLRKEFETRRKLVSCDLARRTRVASVRNRGAGSDPFLNRSRGRSLPADPSTVAIGRA